MKNATELHFRQLLYADATARACLTKKSVTSGSSVANLSANVMGGGLVLATGVDMYGVWHNASGKTKRSLAFCIRRNGDSDYRVSLVVMGTEDSSKVRVYDLVSNASATATYICYAKVKVHADASEEIQAWAQDVANYDAGISFQVSTTANIIDESTFAHYDFTSGSYGTAGGFFKVDEIAVATAADDIVVVDAALPKIDTAEIAKSEGALTLSVSVSKNDAAVTATATDDDANEIEYDLGNAMAGGDAVTTTLTGLSAGTTYAVAVKAVNGTSVATQDAGTVYGSPLTLAVTREGSEEGMVAAQITVSRSAADDLPFTFTYATSDGTAIAGVNYTATSGSATIPSGATSAVVEVPVLYSAATADTAFNFSVDGNFVGSASPVSVTIKNYELPADKNCWTGAAGDGLASTAANWSQGVPTADSAILLDRFATADMTWDAGVNGLPSTVATWTQNEGYTGTVTFNTKFPVTGDSFQTFTVTGAMVVNGGTLTHPLSVNLDNYAYVPTIASLRAAYTYRLCIQAGSFALGSSAKIDAVGKGHSQRKTSSNTPTIVPAHGSQFDGASVNCYGNPKYPEDIGIAGNLGTDSASKHGVGGGAVKLKVIGACAIDGEISVDGSVSSGKLAAGAAGSVLIEAASVTGSGTIHADGVYCGNSSGCNGAPGRIAVIATSQVDLSKLTLSASCVGTGTYVPCGTVYVKDATMTNGKLYMVNRLNTSVGATMNRYALVTSEPDVDWTFDGIVFGGRAMLYIPNGATLNLPNGLASVTTASGYTTCASAIVYKGGEFNFGSGDQTLSGYWMLTCWSNLVFNGNVTIGNGAIMGVPQFGAVNDNSKEKLPSFMLCDVTVKGNLTIESAGAVCANRCGFKKPGKQDVHKTYGLLGCNSHGGRSLYFGRNTGSDNIIYTGYDSFFHPKFPGCSMATGSSAGDCGGVIKLTVLGDLVNNGVIKANGWSESYNQGGNISGGCGGALDITAKNYSGTGSIEANGGSYGWQRGAGGRIALYLTEATSLSDDCLSRIWASGRSRDNGSTSDSSAGTFYLQTAADGERSGSVYIRQSSGNRGVFNTNTTEMVSLGYGGDAVADYKKVNYVVSDYGRAAVNTDFQAKSVKLATTDAFLDLEGNDLTVSKFQYAVTDGETISFKKLSAGTYSMNPSDGQLAFPADCSNVYDTVSGGTLTIKPDGLRFTLR